MCVCVRARARACVRACACAGEEVGKEWAGEREVKSHSTRLSRTLILRNRNDTTQELVTVYVLANTALSPEHIKTRKK